MGWKDKLVGTSTDGVTREQRRSIETTVEHFLGEGAPVAHGLRYVLEGAPEEVLASARRCRGVCDPEVAALAGRLAELPDEVALRWARLLTAHEALPSAMAATSRLAPLPSGPWHDRLLVAAVRGQHRTSLEHLARLAGLDGASEEAFLTSVFVLPRRSYVQVPERAVANAADLGPYLSRVAGVLTPIVLGADVKDRLRLLGLLRLVDAQVVGSYADFLVAAATGGSADVRTEAARLLPTARADVAPRLDALARDGSATERQHALAALYDLADDDAGRAAVLDRARADRAASVRALAERWASTATPADAEATWELPPVPPVRWANAVSPGLRAALATAADRMVRDTEAAREARRQLIASRAGSATWRADPLPPPPDDLPARLEDMVTSDLVADEHLQPWLPRTVQTNNAIPPLAGHPDLPWPALVRLLNANRSVNATPAPRTSPLEVVRSGFALDPLTIAALTKHHTATGKGSLRDLAAIYDDMGWPGASVVFTAAVNRYQPLGRGWAPDAVWPFVAEHLDGILGLFDEVRGGYWSSLERWLELLAGLPTQPPAVRRTLLEHALGTKRAGRAETQAALAGAEDLWADVVPALADGKADVRGVAATWLTRIADPRALPALEAAVAKERNEVVKGQLLDALEALGRPVEDYLDLDALAADAAATAAKPLPAELGWFPWDGLPVVRWAGSGEPVARDVLVHLVVQAQRAKSPEPGAILRKYCSMFEPADRERLGQLVLDAWIAADLTPMAHEDALAEATRRAQSTQSLFHSHPQYFQNDPRRHLSFDQLVATEYAQTSRQPSGSCIASKGVLAVAAACAGAGAADSAGRYLREWYGLRAAQGKALIATLGWVEHPSATQLMLSIGSRFRTKGLQDEAHRQAIALAERRGWTLDELADRTIPTAGLDETGVLRLSYGPREFTATLRPDLTLALHAEDGKEVKALPPPRASDDTEAVKAAKKALTTARKELKGIESEQTTRLYEAMCLQRGWPVADWQSYLRDHPVLRFLVQRLVWRAEVPAAERPGDGSNAEGAATALTFRPLDDGTLTDVEDEEVTLPEDAVITLAHETSVPAGQGSRWLEHLADYEVSPAFTQFGKETFELTEDRRLDTDVTDFEGHLVEALKLRGRATKLGYVRGQVEDAGWFYTYEKRFPTLRLAALIEFSGNGLPEDNRTVALKRLRFVVRDPEAGGGPVDVAVALGEVSPLLLAEAFDDLRSLAAAGTGHDPDWEAKTQP